MNFKSHLLEYLTDEQRKRYSHIKMDDDARAATDHHFGVGKDVVHGVVDDVIKNKSETHQAIERHFGREISHDEYAKGVAPGADPKYPDRSPRYSKVLPKALHDEYVKDPSKAGAKKAVTGLRTTTHRGVEVMGQTNTAPNKEHPTGHSWPESCKRITSNEGGDHPVYHSPGINHGYLEPEVRAGSLVHFVHDNDGKEIYRATLQPHTNEHGHVAYAVNAEYGLIHPKFTQSAHAAAKAASDPVHKMGTFKMKAGVYGNGAYDEIKHPGLDADHFDKVAREGSDFEKKQLLRSNDIKAHHVKSLLKDKSPDIAAMAYSHHAYTPDEGEIEHGVNHDNSHVRLSALFRSTNPEHVKQAYHSPYGVDQEHVLSHRHAPSEIIHHAIASGDHSLARVALRNTNVDHTHIDAALEVKGRNPALREMAAEHYKASPENLHKALSDPAASVRRLAVSNQMANSSHIEKALHDEDETVRSVAAHHRTATPEHLEQFAGDSSLAVRGAAIGNHKLSSRGVSKALSSGVGDHHVSNIHMNKNLESFHIEHLLDNHSAGNGSHFVHGLLNHPSANGIYLDHILDNPGHPAYKGVITHKDTKLKARHIDAAITHGPSVVSNHMLAGEHLKPHHVSKILDDERFDRNKKMEAIHNHGATNERVLMKAVEPHRDPNVASAAVNSPNATPAVLHKAMDHPHWMIRSDAAEHPGATPDVLSRASRDEDVSVRSAALKHPNIAREDLVHASLHDTDHNLRKAAEERLK